MKPASLVLVLIRHGDIAWNRRLFTLSTASISVLGLDSDGDQQVLQLWNDTPHLRG
ncbi:MAG TPA: hypothetical protein VFZ09_08230 [Archangium sp.]|uniref:hypothetical protein n=1 Tax=Archangium sp. TaxID=1872627 RepID=UPI002E3458B8|nr:hypothetical protein [Archangium sp.]HEX5746217.1 hypothetical protein [Archangium sp.]